MDVIYVIGGLAALALGGELLVRGAVVLAERVGVSPLLSALVIVGFGTSTPELIVSLGAAFEDRPDIAIGNVVGSTIFNALFIAGLCAVIAPIAVRPSVARRDGVASVLVALLFVVLASGGGVLVPGELSRFDGSILLAGMAVYLVWTYCGERNARGEPEDGAFFATAPVSEAGPATPVAPRSTGRALAMVLGSLLLMVGGSRLFLVGAVSLAQRFGLSEAVIGVTLVAAGTSLPELFVAVVATLRSRPGVAIGSVLGSNIFNVLGILGVSALVRPLAVSEQTARLDAPAMVIASVLLVACLWSGRRFVRREGVVLLAVYVGYLVVSVA